MDREQRIAIARVISDMIKADNIIEESEIRDMKQLITYYSITHQDMADARNIKFSEAISSLQELPYNKCREIVEKIYDIAKSDNICVPREALLLIALKYCLLGEDKRNFKHPYIVSCATEGVSLNDQYIVYVEDKYDEVVNEQLERNFRLLVLMARLSGFNFIYIPKMVSEFRSMNKEYVLDVISYMAPNLDEDFIKSVYNRLCRMTTKEFFKDVLYERLQVRTPNNIPPSLLINIGTSVVPYCSTGGSVQYYTELLCIPIENDILTVVEELLGYFESKVSIRHTISYGDDKGHFKYFGFYKALFDFLIAPPPVAPNLVFLGQNMKTGKYQVAFVFDNGFEKRVDFTPKEYDTYHKIAKRSVEGGGLPVGTDNGLKSVISHIKSKISDIVPDLTYSGQYKPERHNNTYILRLDCNKIFKRRMDYDNGCGYKDCPINQA